jgi:multiple sugar transport system permease protein
MRGFLAVALTVLFLAPLWLLAVGSLRAAGTPPPVRPELLPANPAWRNYVEVFRTVPLGRYMANSLLVAAAAVPIGVVVASWAGFAIARLPPRQAAMLAGVCAAAALVPVTALLVGRVAIWRTVGLAGTPVPLMASGLVGVSPVTALLFAWSYRRLPPELFDLAWEAGLTPLATWWRVAVPLTRPVTAAAAALAFITSWGNFVEPLVILTDERWFTLPLGVRSLATLDPPFQPLMLAGAMVTIAPVIAAFGVVLWATSRRRLEVGS